MSRTRKPPISYRTIGDNSPDPRCLLDVLAAAGAARASGQLFSFRLREGRGEAVFPSITEEQAREVLAEIDGQDLTILDDSPYDLMRGAGQMGLISDRVRNLARTIHPRELVAWAEHRAEMYTSLRWETYHVSDVPAAHRWQGSKPIPRLSHPGRNMLAVYTLLHRIIPIVTLPRCGIKPTKVRPLEWLAPLTPVSYKDWSARLFSDLGRIGSPRDGVSRFRHDCDPVIGAWFSAPVAMAGKALYLAMPEEIPRG